MLQSSNFQPFRKIFEAELKKIFVVPANTFDNVKGSFPIGFMIWDTQNKKNFDSAEADIYQHTGQFLAKKTIHSYKDNFYINDWIKKYVNNENNFVGILAYLGNDFQNTNQVRLTLNKPTSHLSTIFINRKNIIPISIYFSVRHCIAATWLNDRDQFLVPNNGWEEDTAFQNDCLAFCLFHGQNKITNKDGANHWIPFTEKEVKAREKFDSNFMAQFINGKLQPEPGTILFGSNTNRTTPLAFSPEAAAVFDAGGELWKYYHATIKNMPPSTEVKRL